jgi:hypothetical protein
MKDVDYIINCLEKTPVILNHLLLQISKDLYRIRRVEGKWSIHEQVCHLVEAQKILIERFIKFEKEKKPFIRSYDPIPKRSGDYYLDMNMQNELSKFPSIRKELIKMLRSYDMGYWDLSGNHECFNPYNTRILLTHSLNVDYAHMFSIEQLGFTRAECIDNIMTIP